MPSRTNSNASENLPSDNPGSSSPNGTPNGSPNGSQTGSQNDSNTSNPTTTTHHSRYANGRNGATSLIRRRLNFMDEILWKKFTQRRLHLVETLSLSSKKASEQDGQISICARTLMNEFGYGEATLEDFDKLVRLAIQSVRRNKKRSEKRQANKFQEEEQRRKKQHSESTKFLSSIMIDETPGMVHLGSSSSSQPQPVANGMSRLAINSLVAPVLPDDRNHDRLPSLRRMNLNPEFTAAAEKILLQIKTSKTCYDFSYTQGANTFGGGSAFGTTPSNPAAAVSKGYTRNYDLLEEMGASCVSTAVLFTLEKWYDHLLLDSSGYIKLRLKGDLTLSLVVKNLDPTSVEVSRLSDYVAAQLFKKLIGGCVKDFGFNAVLYPLCDIFHGIIAKDFPLITKETKIHQMSAIPGTNSLFYQSTTTTTGAAPAPAATTTTTTTTGTALAPTTTTTSAAAAAAAATTTTSAVASTTTTTQAAGPGVAHHIPVSLAAPTTTTSTSTASPTPGLPPILTGPTPQNRISLPPLGFKTVNVVVRFNGSIINMSYSQGHAPPTMVELLTSFRSAFGIADQSRTLKIKDNVTGAFVGTDLDLAKIFRATEDHVDLELVFSSATLPSMAYDHLDTGSSSSDHGSSRADSQPIFQRLL